MKKLILSLGMMSLGFGAMSQVIFSVEAPASIQGFYDFKGNDDGSGWGLASLSGILVIDTVVIPNDGTPGVNAQGNPASASGCNALAPGSLAGKIAMVFRGDGGNPGVGVCNFGLKALNCQNAGALAVIIVNRDATTISMAGSTEGASVTIPVVMVNLTVGQSIMNTITGGTDVVALIGDKTGYFNDDLSTFPKTSVRADFGAKPLDLAQDASEFSFSPGTWVYNNGQNDQTGITLTTTITRNGTQVYTNTSAAAPILSGDSLYMTTSMYSSPTYSTGYYEVEYLLEMPAMDQFAGDNISSSNFSLTDSLWSLSGLNEATMNLDADGFYRSSTTPASNFEMCMAFKDANASRVAVDGVYFGGLAIGAADTAALNLDGAEISWTLYTWDDVDQTITTGTITALTEEASGFINLANPAVLETTIFIPIESAPYYRLADNQSYMLCYNNYYPLAYMGFNTTDHYDLALNTDDMIRFPQRADNGTWVNGGFSGFPVPSIALRTGAELGVADNTNIEATAFPVPAKDVITVRLNASGDASLKITDMAGRTVSTQDVKLAGGQFTTNVAGMNAGTYIFSLEFANGTSSRFNVVVTK